MKRIFKLAINVFYDYLKEIIIALIVLTIAGSEFTPLKIWSKIVLPVLLYKYSGWIAFVILSIYLLFDKYRQKLFTKPVATLKLVPQYNQNRWSPGSLRGMPITHLVCSLYVSNVSNVNVFVCRAMLRKRKVEGSVFVRRSDRDIYGSYPIPPGHTTEMSIDFVVPLIICKKNKPYNSSVDVIDQFENKHRVHNIKFLPIPETKEEPPRPPLEIISEIQDPIEKSTVAVLQAELDRYRNCGRRVGGLGSIVTTYKGQTFHGMGTEWRKPDSPELQSVVPDPDNAKIESDNASILIKLHSSLSVDQKNIFTDTLLKRLSRETAYASIGYFVLFVLFCTGNLSKALTAAKEKLQNDETYGFSDLLILLNGMLRYEYPKFTVEMLDDIERFIKNINEHTFNIQEKINVIRTIFLKEDLNKKPQII